MQVRKREYASGRTGWQVDISGVTEDGKPFRHQLQAPEDVTSKSGARRWGEEQRRRCERGEPPATVRAARKAERERLAAEQASAKVDAVLGATVAEAVQWYVEDGRIARLAPTSIETRERICANHVCPLMGDVPVRLLEDSHVRALALRVEPLSASFARLVMRVFRGVLDAARARKVECSLVVKLPKEPSEEEPRAYDPGSYERLVAAAAELSPTNLAVVLLSGEAALRRGEILGLTVGDVLAAAGTRALKIERQVVRVNKRDIVLPPKHGRTRSVPLSRRCADVLETLAAERPPNERLILSSDGGGPATESAIRWYLHEAQRAAGLPSVGPHAARHTALSHMLSAGSDLKVVQAVAGHRHVRTTARYLHAMPDAVARAGTQVEAWRQNAAVTSVQLAPKPRSRGRVKVNDSE